MLEKKSCAKSTFEQNKTRSVKSEQVCSKIGSGCREDERWVSQCSRKLFMPTADNQLFFP